MSDNEIIFVLRNLSQFGCPAHILGCDPSIKSKEQDSSIIETGIQTLFRPSETRNELLKWIDSELFANHSIENGDDSTNQKTHPGTLDLMKGVKTRLSCILSTDTETFFGNKPQVMHTVLMIQIPTRLYYSSFKCYYCMLITFGFRIM